MKSLLIAAIACLSLLVPVPPAQASAKDFDVTAVTNNDTSNVHTGNNQFKIEVIDSGARVAIKVKNTGSVKSAITGIYFDDHVSNDFQSVYSIANAPNVSFGLVTPPSALPEGLSTVPGFAATDIFCANGQQEKKGVNPGRYVTINFNLTSGTTWQDVVDDLTSGELQVGMLSCFNDNTAVRESFVALPEPATVTILAMGFLSLPLTRKRS
jgi:hypothetical protein